MRAATHPPEEKSILDAITVAIIKAENTLIAVRNINADRSKVERKGKR